MPALTRRRALAGAAVVGVGAVGAVAGLLRPVARPHRASAPTSEQPSATPPAALVSAAARERELVARLAASGTTPALRARLASVSADHRAHLDALQSLLTAYRGVTTSPSGSPSATAAPSGAVSVALLRSHETAAARAAAAESAALSGPAAAVLASIAACEAGHAVVLGGDG